MGANCASGERTCCTCTSGRDGSAAADSKDCYGDTFVFVDQSPSISNTAVVAGGYGTGYEKERLWRPRSFVLHRQEHFQTLVIADSGNRRVVLWPYMRCGLRQAAFGHGPVVVAAPGEHPEDSAKDHAASFGVSWLGDFLKVGLDGKGRLLCSSYDSCSGQTHLLAQVNVGLEKQPRFERLSISDSCCAPIVCACGGPEDALYVLESGGQRVLKFRREGDDWAKEETVAGGHGHGSKANQFDAASNIVVTSDGTIYVTDHQNHRVQRWPVGAKEGETVAGGNGCGSACNQLDCPRGLSVDSDKTVYIADYKNNRVVRWRPGDLSGQTLAAPEGTQVARPVDVVLDGLGGLLVLEAGSDPRIMLWKIAVVNDSMSADMPTSRSET
eukprot:TRINITY_DN102602_c0_g1_i1.p1 TRINITY_DN102602_c0_g1~~TRINITY_DN102602_c0_g1_i1.p1  ORF type:complete len:406 (-),score=56.70 TRINITY_DN102602_c0_g1_i1:115-1266(-)